MNFAFGVVCKVPNSFAKSKIVQLQGILHLDLANPKCGPYPRIFFFTDRARAFFSLYAILTYVVRASRRPAQVFAPIVAQPRPRSSPSSFASVRGRRPRAAAGGRRARAARRADGRREIARGGGGGGTESDVEDRNCRCKVVEMFAYMQSLNLYLQS
jgi:hypothetical protein